MPADGSAVLRAAILVDSLVVGGAERVVQALGEATGNTLILGMPPQSTPVPVAKKKATKKLKGKAAK